MRDIDACIKEKIIIEDDKDINRAKSLLNLANLRGEFWKEKYDQRYNFLILEGLYETIKELLTAIINLCGYKSSSHECLIAFFKDRYPDNGYEADIIDTMRKIRNSINYRGIYTDDEFLKKNKLEIFHIIELLQRKIKDLIKADKE